MMSKATLISILHKLGWFVYDNYGEALSKVDDKYLQWVLKAYSIFHGISVNEVENHLTLPRMCALPDVMLLSGNLSRWPTKNISWSVINRIGNLDPGSIVACANEAFKRWSDVCGIIPTYKANDRTAMIVIDSRNIDGPYGVLGESELPGGQAQCHQWYDNQEPWIISDNPSNNQIDLTRVQCHEIGHALGMSHIGAGNLLAPIYSPQISKPQQGDIQEMQARYGPPIPIPTPIPEPPPGDGGTTDEIIIHIRGGTVNIPGYRLTKLQ